MSERETTARVALVKSATRAESFLDALRAAGLQGVLVSPFVREEIDGAAERLQAELSRGADWVAVTSPSAAPVLARVAVHGAQVAAVGTGTASALVATGLEVTVVGDRGGEALGAHMYAAGLRAGDRVVHPCGADVRPELAASLCAHGATVVAVPVYRMLPDPVGERAAQEGRFDALVVTSPRNALRALSLFDPLPPLVAVGETTSEVLLRAGVAAVATATDPSPGGVVEAVRKVMREPRAGPR